MSSGLAPDSLPAQALTRRHRDWIARSWPHPVTRTAYENLANLYGEHPDFRARYEAQAPGMTAYLQGAMRAFAARDLG